MTAAGTEAPTAEAGMPPRCFIISPIGAAVSIERRHADMIYEVVLRPALEPLGYALERSDKTPDPGQITTAIFQALLEADLCVVDLTFLNANVLYELGVRHAVHRPVIQIAAIGTSLPFDTANQRTIFFDAGDIYSLRVAAEAIVAQVDTIRANPDSLSNPLTAALGLIEQPTGDSTTVLIREMSARLDALESRLGTTRGTVAQNASAAILGQGELATKNMQEIRRLWMIDQLAALAVWQEQENGSVTTQVSGFSIGLEPRSRGRWASHAVQAGSGFSVPYPPWQNSLGNAQRAILGAVADALVDGRN